MDAIKSVNAGIRFLWEVIALINFGYWGIHTASHTVMKIIVGIGAPLLVAIIWGTFGSPKAPYRLIGFSRLLLEVLIFGGATIALLFAGKQTLGIIYGVIALINLILIHLWKQ